MVVEWGLLLWVRFVNRIDAKDAGGEKMPRLGLVGVFFFFEIQKLMLCGVANGHE